MTGGPTLAVLISGRGSNLEAILRAAERDAWPARIGLVLSNRPDAAGLAIARRWGVPTCVVDHDAFPDRGSFDDALATRLAEAGTDWVVLAGFMRLLGGAVLGPWAGRVLNIHPSLLPRHPGLKPHRAALAAGDRESGCTVHLVGSGVDDGPIIAQSRVRVLPEDSPATLAARVLRQEHVLYPSVLAALVSGTLRQRFPGADLPADWPPRSPA